MTAWTTRPRAGCAPLVPLRLIERSLTCARSHAETPFTTAAAASVTGTSHAGAFSMRVRPRA